MVEEARFRTYTHEKCISVWNLDPVDRVTSMPIMEPIPITEVVIMNKSEKGWKSRQRHFTLQVLDILLCRRSGKRNSSSTCSILGPASFRIDEALLL